MIIKNETIKALNTGFKDIFKNALAGSKPVYEKLATATSSKTASNTYGWLGQMPGLEEWVGKRNLKNVKEHGYTIANKTFEASIEVKRTDIEDDNLGIYKSLVTALGQQAAEHPDVLVFEILNKGEVENCYDGKPFFSTDHKVNSKADGSGDDVDVSNLSKGEQSAWYLFDTSKALKPLIYQERQAPEFSSQTDASSESVFMEDNFRYGVRARGNVGFGFWQLAYKSTKELNAENFNAAVAAMMSQTADGGKPLNVMPTLLVVPPQLREKALEIVKAERLANGSTNVNQGLVELLITPRVMTK